MAEQKKTNEALNVEDALTQSEAFFIKNKKAIIGAVVAVIIIIAGVVMYKNLYADPREEKAQAALFKGQEYFEADAYAQQGGAGGQQYWSSNGGGSPFEGFDFSSFGEGGGGFSSFFQDLFGAKAGRTHSRTRSSARQNTGEMNANVNIDLYTALLGGEVIIQLGNGSKIKLKVKPETQNGTKVRLRGKGYDRGDGTMGDLIITYNVKLPTNLSERQKQLLKEMQQS
jgi:curved DNA-binding protein